MALARQAQASLAQASRPLEIRPLETRPLGPAVHQRLRVPDAQRALPKSLMWRGLTATHMRKSMVPNS